jgi:predicted HTH domain antitoxin
VLKLVSLQKHIITKIMTTITLEVPDSLAEYQNDTVRFIAAKLYESGKLSLGQAADMARLTKRTFAELLADYGVSFINYSPSDLKDELDRISGI